jgi:hypothetical protein
VPQRDVRCPPRVWSLFGLGERHAAITAAIASGDLTISEGAEIAKIIETFVHALESTELERRLRAVEEQRK